MRDSPEDFTLEDDAFSFDISDDPDNLSSFEGDSLGIDSNIDNTNNQRKTIRYIRNDITAFVNQNIAFGYTGQPKEVHLVDISSKGALISSDKNMRLHSTIHLFLTFKSRKKFQVEASIVRKTMDKHYFYGLKFEKFNHELAEYMLETQTELIFK